MYASLISRYEESDTSALIFICYRGVILVIL